MTLHKIVSGGQTGVDRGALDAALAAGFPCGAWCPAGRKAEDGSIPDSYPLQELPGAGYIQRTRKNVEGSDATLILTFGPATGGTLRTIGFCQQLGKPYRVIDAAVTSIDEAVRLAADFVEGKGVGRLNVAGPRSSGWSQGHVFAAATVGKLIENFREVMG